MTVATHLRTLVGAVLLAALAACGGGEPPTPSGAQPASPPLTLDVGEGVPADAQPAQVVSLAVEDGKVVGDTGTVEVRLGSRVRLSIVSDVSDTVLVDGYGLRQLLPVAFPTQLEFVAGDPGTVSVRLEDSGLVLTRLKVQ